MTGSGNKFVKIEQTVFEAGVLAGTPNESQPQSDAEPKSDSIRIWQYIAVVLGVSLLVAIVLLWLSKPDLPVVHMLNEVAFIPAGEFRMGGSGSDAESDEHPEHTVHVDAFFIDKYEVTNAQYQFVDANPQWQKNSVQRVFHNGKYLNLCRITRIPPAKRTIPLCMSVGMRRCLRKMDRSDCQPRQNGKKLRGANW